MFPQAVKILKNKAGATKVARLVIIKIKTRYHVSNRSCWRNKGS